MHEIRRRELLLVLAYMHVHLEVQVLAVQRDRFCKPQILLRDAVRSKGNREMGRPVTLHWDACARAKRSADIHGREVRSTWACDEEVEVTVVGLAGRLGRHFDVGVEGLDARQELGLQLAVDGCRHPREGRDGQGLEEGFAAHWW
jgi:hypothetical protein